VGAAHVAGTVRLRLVVAYNGASFHGVTPQPRLRTVGGVLIEAITRVLRQPTPVAFTCAGRTDRGVHGWGQVVHVDVAGGSDIDTAALHRRLNKMLSPALVVRHVDVAPPGFDARHSAIWRRYRYTLLVQPDPSPFLIGTTWHVPPPLSLDTMRLGCDGFLGTHDFTSFGRIPRDRESPSMVRTILDARWFGTTCNRGEDDQDRDDRNNAQWVFEVTATSFCQQMVRAIVGFLVEIGRGRRSAGDVLAVIAAKDRAAAAPIAPPHGLMLWEVGYPVSLGFSGEVSAGIDPRLTTS
jgi:tRNA pseudouridine38-40 synthase